MFIRVATYALVAVTLTACSKETSAPARESVSSEAATSTAATATAATATAATTSVAAEPGSAAALRSKAEGVLAALKKGDATAAGAFCLGKHKEGLTKYLEEHLDKKDGSRGAAFRSWDGTLGAIRIEDGKRARVAFGGDGDGFHVLAFRQVDGAWSLDDVPSMSKESFEKWGAPATE